VIVDDRAWFVDAARQLLEARGYEVIAEAGCAMTAWDAVERHAPEAVLLDVRLGAHGGFSVCGALTRARPDLAVLLTSTDEHGEDSEELLARCGARGFVRKSNLPRTDLTKFWP
jgi:DNA-binding NarL/FixJ family response regulator